MRSVKRLLGLAVGAAAVAAGTGVLLWSVHRHPRVPPVRLARGPAEIVVVGGGPAALTAASVAAEMGQRVLLLIPPHAFGGTILQSWLTSWDLSRGPNGHLLTQGAFLNWWRELGGHDSFSLAQARAYMERLLHTPNLVVERDAAVVGVLLHRGYIADLLVERHGHLVRVGGKRFIDATPNADVAVLAGVPYRVGLGVRGYGSASQADSEIFRVTGVNWPQVLAALQPSRWLWVKRLARALPDSAWGGAAFTAGYRSVHGNVELRGLNLARQPDGSVLVNAVWVFGVNGLEPRSLRAGKAAVVAELPRILEYLRRHVPGFAHARLAGVAPQLYVRQTRQIVGMYTLTINDVLNNRIFPDRVVLASYPVDIQAYTPGNHGVVVGKPVCYSIPFRSLVPVGVGNLLVVGRSASYSGLAEGSARTLPVGIDEGQAAAVASVLALPTDRSYAELARDRRFVHRLQRKLVSEGADLTPPAGLSHRLPVPEWAAKAFLDLRAQFILLGGYDNTYPVHGLETEAAFRSLLSQVLHVNGQHPVLPAVVGSGTRPLSLREALRLALVAMGRPEVPPRAQAMVAAHLLPGSLLPHFRGDGPLTAVQALVLAEMVNHAAGGPGLRAEVWEPAVVATGTGQVRVAGAFQTR